MHDIFWHGGIYLACKFNEACMSAILARLPREIKWINGETVTAKAGARIEGHESKWLRFRSFNDFPDINPHCAINEL